MKRIFTLIALLACMVAALAVPAVTSAATFYEQSNCTQADYAADTARFTLYEHASIPSNGAADDRAPMCWNASDLDLYGDVVECDGHLWYQEPDWNDCADSVSAVIPAFRVLCFYKHRNYEDGGVYPYTGIIGYLSGGTTGRTVYRTPLAFAPDVLSSVRWVVGIDGDDCAN